jgi:unsaturated rhamnogalacturonyl hydrolase
MKKFSILIVLAISFHGFAKPKTKEVLAKLHVAKAYFQQKWPDVSAPIPRPDRIRPSNIWTRAVYYEGLMELYKIDPKAADMKYMLDWANFHQWNLRDGIKTRNADNQACGQIYLDLFDFQADSLRILPIKANVDLMVNSSKADV